MITTLSPATSKTGDIEVDYSSGSPVWTVDTTTAVPDTGFIPSPVWASRTYWNFNTSSLPPYAFVRKVEFYLSVFSALSGGPTCPSTWKTSFNVGTWIGAALDVSDFWGGTYCAQVSGTPSTQWVDLGWTGVGAINLTGETDVMVYDQSNYSLPCAGWSVSLRKGGKSGCLLRVTWFPKWEMDDYHNQQIPGVT